MLTALEQQREDQALGAAWRRCEAALPEGWILQLGDWSAEPHRTVPLFEAYAESYAGPSRSDYRESGAGPTPTAALEALAEALESRRAAEE